MRRTPKSIQIRDVPDDVHRELRIRAAAAGMSLSDFLRQEITRDSRRRRVSEILRRADEREEGVPIEEIISAMREVRDG